MRLAITSIIFLILTVSLQALLPDDLFFGGKIDFALILVVYVSLVSESSIYVLVFAFFGGLLVDSFSSSYFGSSAVIYLIIAYAITFFHRKLYFDNILTMMLLPFFATIGKTFIMLLIMVLSNLLLNGDHIVIDKYFISMLSELLMNVLFSPILYLLLNLITGNKKRSF